MRFVGEFSEWLFYFNDGTTVEEKYNYSETIHLKCDGKLNIVLETQVYPYELEQKLLDNDLVKVIRKMQVMKIEDGSRDMIEFEYNDLQLKNVLTKVYTTEHGSNYIKLSNF